MIYSMLGLCIFSGLTVKSIYDFEEADDKGDKVLYIIGFGLNLLALISLFVMVVLNLKSR